MYRLIFTDLSRTAAPIFHSHGSKEIPIPVCHRKPKTKRGHATAFIQSTGYRMKDHASLGKKKTRWAPAVQLWETPCTVDGDQTRDEALRFGRWSMIRLLEPDPQTNVTIFVWSLGGEKDGVEEEAIPAPHHLSPAHSRGFATRSLFYSFKQLPNENQN
jgi:hypothetical protein